MHNLHTAGGHHMNEQRKEDKRYSTRLSSHPTSTSTTSQPFSLSVIRSTTVCPHRLTPFPCSPPLFASKSVVIPRCCDCTRASRCHSFIRPSSLLCRGHPLSTDAVPPSLTCGLPPPSFACLVSLPLCRTSPLSSTLLRWSAVLPLPSIMSR
jgi:hypothetical protein